MKMVRRYNIQDNVWEIGYYVSSRFYIVRVVKNVDVAA